MLEYALEWCRSDGYKIIEHKRTETPNDKKFIATIIVTVDELAKLLGVAKVTILRWAKRGKIPSFRIGTMVRFDPQAISRWLLEQGVQSLPEAVSVRDGKASWIINGSRMDQELSPYVLHGPSAALALFEPPPS